MIRPGELLATGRTSEVFAFGEGSVVKLLRSEVPDGWAEREARLTDAVQSCGVRVQAVKGLVEIDDRQGIVFERIVGPTMWQAMLDKPEEATTLARDLAMVHRTIQRGGIPPGLPDLAGRLRSNILEAARLPNESRREACALVKALPLGATLLHGDLHPGNVMIDSNGPIVIDWFDAAIGHPLADVVRSSILLRRPASGDAPQHLPGATPDLRDAIHDAYRSEFQDLFDNNLIDLRAWETVVAAGRMAEGVEGEEAMLSEIWEARAL